MIAHATPVFEQQKVFFLQVFERHDGFGRPVYLDIVAVYERNDIVELIFADQHGSFPHVALIQLAVA